MVMPLRIIMTDLTGSLYSASGVRLHKQAPEASLRTEVHHQTSLFIDAHAGRIQST